MPGMPGHAELILRLLLAATLAGVLGIERELTDFERELGILLPKREQKASRAIAGSVRRPARR